MAEAQPVGLIEKSIVEHHDDGKPPVIEDPIIREFDKQFMKKTQRKVGFDETVLLMISLISFYFRS